MIVDVEKLIQKGNACIKEREDIPSAPLWHMGKVALNKSKESFDLLQNTVDYLTCKGKIAKSFTDNEKEFMKELFEALWWGGQYKGFSEAAKLANHYVNGNGKPIKINSKVYKSSIIVTDTINELKKYIRSQSSKALSIPVIITSDPIFLLSSYANSLKQGTRSVSQQGYMLSNGALLVEQSNLRLKNADHRFYLRVSTVRTHQFLSTWKIESIYDFEPFGKSHITDIPLAEGFVLKLPDGLSHYLTTIGVAKDFKYRTEWQEFWE